MGKRPLQHKRGRNEGHPLGPRPPPNSLRAHAWDYLEALRVLQRTPAAVKGQAKALTAFMSWCEERGLLRSEDVTRPILERYQRHLFYVRKPNGQPLAASTQYGALVVVRQLFRWQKTAGAAMTRRL